YSCHVEADAQIDAFLLNVRDYIPVRNFTRLSGDVLQRLATDLPAMVNGVTVPNGKVFLNFQVIQQAGVVFVGVGCGEVDRIAVDGMRNRFAERASMVEVVS